MVARLVSRLTNDGILTVEAPVNPPSYRAVVKSRDTPTSQSHTPVAVSRDQDHAHELPESQIITTGQFNFTKKRNNIKVKSDRKNDISASEFGYLHCEQLIILMENTVRYAQSN